MESYLHGDEKSSSADGECPSCGNWDCDNEECKRDNTNRQFLINNAYLVIQKLLTTKYF